MPTLTDNRASVIRAAIISGLSVLFVYGGFTLLPLKSPWNALMLLGSEKSYYEALRFLRFNAAYLPALVLLFLWCLRHRPFWIRNPWWAMLYGTVAGYGAGFAAYVCISLFRPGVSSFLNNLTGYGWVLPFFAPLVMITWLFGGLVGLTAYLIEKRCPA